MDDATAAKTNNCCESPVGMTSTYIKFNVNGIVSSDIAIRPDAISMYLLLLFSVIDLFVLIMSVAKSLASLYALLIDLIARKNRFFFFPLSLFFVLLSARSVWPDLLSLLWCLLFDFC